MLPPWHNRRPTIAARATQPDALTESGAARTLGVAACATLLVLAVFSAAVTVGASVDVSSVEGKDQGLVTEVRERSNQCLADMDLKRLYWNLRRFRTGHRKNQTPYGRLGLKLPDLSFWEFLKLTPEELRKQLSAQGDAT